MLTSSTGPDPTSSAGRHPRQPDRRITEAQREGWRGEVEGLQIGLAGAEEKLAQLDNLIARRSTTASLGMPTIAGTAIRTTGTPTDPHQH
ncbi:hypothetical protein [Streptomyces sp. JV184]|uniref:hypothetical protein n=1 Tax=Streptomyces sp. JV184 TaxID=858637 RepID=UPI002E79CEEF|nr:hypothetical protein [Streptomyces sp. JV184]MEE1745664.1 hypothetical protein [Streptomyces sp. JV184]